MSAAIALTLVAGVLVCMSCGGDGSRDDAERRMATEPSAAAMLQPPPAGGGAKGAEPLASDEDGVFFRAAWCDGPGQQPIERFDMMRNIAQGYDDARASDCRTARLLGALTSTQQYEWWDYLIGYSNALAGCPPWLAPIVGGIRAFGPANTRAIGLDRPALGRDDAGLLIQHYLDSFAPALALSATERALVEAQLWEAAEMELDEHASMVLSTCPAGAP